MIEVPFSEDPGLRSVERQCVSAFVHTHDVCFSHCHIHAPSRARIDTFDAVLATLCERWRLVAYSQAGAK